MTNKQLSPVYCLAASILVFEKNGCRVIPFRCPNLISSKQQVKNYLNDPGQAQYITDKLNEAEKISAFLKQEVILLVLTGKKIGFLEHVVSALNKQYISIEDITSICWAPKLYHDFTLEHNFHEKLAEYRGSQYIGNIGSKVIFPATVLHHSYIRQLGKWAVTLTDDKNNLYSFLTKDLSKVKSGIVKGCVRGHDLCKYHNNLRVTKLNYVHVIGENNGHSK